MATITISTADPIVYTYRAREGGKLIVMRRPRWMGPAADNNADWIARIRATRDAVGRQRARETGALVAFVPPAYENLTAYGRPVHTLIQEPRERSFEIASILSRLAQGTDDPRIGREVWVKD